MMKKKLLTITGKRRQKFASDNQLTAYVLTSDTVNVAAKKISAGILAASCALHRTAAGVVHAVRTISVATVAFVAVLYTGVLVSALQHTPTLVPAL